MIRIGSRITKTKTAIFDPRWDRNLYPVLGFNDRFGKPSIPFAKTNPSAPGAFPDPDGAIWPVEFQDPSFYTQKGRISNFDHDPEFREGDFFDLKDVHHGQGSVDAYNPSAALLDLCEVYKYWIAFANIDGYRIDTVKHMDPGATRLFGSAIHEFAQSIGKDNFLLVGEITGGRFNAFDTSEITGLSAALGIDDIPDKMEFLVKGFRNPNEYFSLFRNSLLIGKDSHTWFRNKVVTLFNDHEVIRVRIIIRVVIRAIIRVLIRVIATIPHAVRALVLRLHQLAEVNRHRFVRSRRAITSANTGL